MYGTDYFQYVLGEPQHLGTLTPTGTWTSLERGTVMDRQASYRETHCSPGSGDMQGILSNRVTSDGPSFEKMTLGYPDLDVLKGQAVTLVVPGDGDLIEIEGEPGKAYSDSTLGLLVTSGTGDMTSASAGDKLSVKNGRWYVAQSGDWVLGEVKAAGLTPIADPSNIRYLIEVRRGAKL